ncbi:MAG: endonuclease/exonuclease/phosphatase family protein, partial [Sphingomonas sp.]
SGRPAAFERIAARLVRLRAQGEAPQVVVLQEAFTDAARRIGSEAGYRYVAYGPTISEQGAPVDGSAGRAFLSAARWMHGETEGPVFGSGLVILSDYPIVGTATLAYPRDACAGYDCLANKGAVMARIALPDGAGPVDIVTTHLNCRERTGVAVGRADEAYQRQLASLVAFVRTAHDPADPLVVAGDFNVGRTATRQAAVASVTADLGANPALATLVAAGRSLPADALFSWAKDKDLQLAAPAPGAALTAEAVTTPFGHEPDGSMLSDHVGYVVRYHLGAPARRLAQSATSA